MRLRRATIPLLLGLASLLASPAAAVTIEPSPLVLTESGLVLSLEDVTTGVPEGGENTGCPADVVGCVGASSVSLVLQAINTGDAPIDTVFFAQDPASVPAGLDGLGSIPGANEPDDLVDADALWGSFPSAGTPRVEFPSGLERGESSNLFFLSVSPGSIPGIDFPVYTGSFPEDSQLLHVVPEPGAFALLAGGLLALSAGRARRGAR